MDLKLLVEKLKVHGLDLAEDRIFDFAVELLGPTNVIDVNRIGRQGRYDVLALEVSVGRGLAHDVDRPALPAGGPSRDVGRTTNKLPR